MLKNRAPVTAVARHLGVNRDTLYVRYGDIIKEGRRANDQAWNEIITPVLDWEIRKRRWRQEAKKAKRRYRKKADRYLYRHLKKA